MIGRLHDLADQGETNIDASGSIPTPNATDPRINPIETITVHTMNVRWDASGDVFARSRVGEFFRSSTARAGRLRKGRRSSLTCRARHSACPSGPADMLSAVLDKSATSVALFGVFRHEPWRT